MTGKRADQGEPRLAEAWAALDTVLDPELDESVVSLGFVEELRIEGTTVAVRFRLPTAWCSLTFAWMMAEDMRAALLALDWTGRTDIRLTDHFAAEQINGGVASGRGFAEALGPEAGGDLAALRRVFRRKAFLGRMAKVIEALRDTGRSDRDISRLTVGGLVDLAGKTDGGPELGALVARFLELRGAFGGPAGDEDAAFRTAEGKAIPDGNLPAFLRDIRMTRRSAEANGEMCRVMLRARYEGIDDP